LIRCKIDPIAASISGRDIVLVKNGPVRPDQPNILISIGPANEHLASVVETDGFYGCKSRTQDIGIN